MWRMGRRQLNWKWERYRGSWRIRDKVMKVIRGRMIRLGCWISCLSCRIRRCKGIKPRQGSKGWAKDGNYKRSSVVNVAKQCPKNKKRTSQSHPKNTSSVGQWDSSSGTKPSTSIRKRVWSKIQTSGASTKVLPPLSTIKLDKYRPQKQQTTDITDECWTRVL